MADASSRPGLLLSVVTPAYNQAAFLRDTIESVLGQDYPQIEYRVIDDGSTDGTARLLREYDERLLWETQENRGQTATINQGWSLARGDILTWLNSDDTFLPGAVATAMNYFKRHPDIGIVFGRTLYTTEDGTPIGTSEVPRVFDYDGFVAGGENPIAQPSAFIRREVVEATGLLDARHYYFMDWDYWLRAGLHHKIASIPDVLSTYRLHAESKTVAHARKYAPDLEWMYREFFANGDLPQSLRRLERLAMANMCFTSGGYYMKGGDATAAARMALRALAWHPALIFSPSLFHKLAYCLLGQSPVYRAARHLLSWSGGSWWKVAPAHSQGGIS